MSVLVSIIIPIYGVEKYIERCARSLFEQTYNNIEYVFVNDCTKDSSIEILNEIAKQYPQRLPMVRIINHDVNRGLAAARNTGVDVSRGTYLMHVDSDDYLEKNAVEVLLYKAIEDNADIVVFGNNIIKNNERIINLPRLSVLGESKVDYINSMLLHKIPSSIWNKFYNAVFYKNSGIRSIEGLNHGEDYAVVPRLIHKAQSVSVMDLPLYNYEQSNVNSYMNNITIDSVSNIIQAVNVLKEYFLHVEDQFNYQNAINLMQYRSMLALIKVARKDNYSMIFNTFKLSRKYVSGLSVTDRVLFFMLEYKQYYVTALLINFFLRLKK